MAPWTGVREALVTTPSDGDPSTGGGPSMGAAARPLRRPARLAAVPNADPHLDRLRQAYQEGRGKLWRALLAWSGSAEVADEALSEAFAQAVRRGAEIEDPAAWVWRAAFRIAAGNLAQRRVDRDRTIGLAGIEAALPASLIGVPGDAVDLLRALQQLPDQQRRAVVLTDGAGFSAPEAARILDTSSATVRVQASRARRRLRPLLADVGPESPR
jgi:RNA polymerase sigma-70 factor (ECF subfamily)